MSKQRSGFDSVPIVQRDASKQTLEPLPETSQVKEERKFNSKRPILTNDIPLARQAVEEAIVRGVVNAMRTRGKDYETYFRAQGLDEKSISDLLNYIEAIYEARMELQGASGQLARVRREYDKKVKELLGDKIEQYKQKEMFSASSAEVENLTRFGSNRGVVIDSADQQKLVAIIHEIDAYTDPTGEFGGVYWDWPAAASGGEATAMIKYSAEKLEQQSEEVILRAEKSGVNPTTLQIASDYYAQAVKKYRAMLQPSRGSQGQGVSEKRRIILQQEADHARRARLNQLSK